MTKDEFLNMMVDAKNYTTSMYEYQRYCCNAIEHSYRNFARVAALFTPPRGYFELMFDPRNVGGIEFDINCGDVFFGSVDGFQKERGIALELFERITLDEREYLKW